MKKIVLIVLSIIINNTYGLKSNSLKQIINQVLLISFDGFGCIQLDEFLKENPNSNFQKFINEGIRAEYLKPSFPSATFPNHYTLATGLYPESHGIIGNEVYDSLYDELISLQTNKNGLNPKWWNQTDPLWLTAKYQV